MNIFEDFLSFDEIAFKVFSFLTNLPKFFKIYRSLYFISILMFMNAEVFRVRCKHLF